ncbi:helix-turn-helix domain-containing protein [Microlunatus parietis]|uniref:AraC-like DNA-binding protein n=1 Tax=Microlunatus parietis TaxID=682979 RepID=A0A7Y9ICU8_9ACTN|nr:helix-turn-helix domain-containing protein [Microlunatus parietis]NYE74256.1 AraC-like DNA-binding protein [Microlunatus parietis]
MEEPAAVTVTGYPARALMPFVQRYHGARFEDLAPCVHRGLPSHQLEFIICLGQPLMINSSGGLLARPYAGLVGGLHRRPVNVALHGSMRNVSLELTPRGARKLLGVPAAELAGQFVDLDALLGKGAAELTERLASATDWAACWSVLDDSLSSLASRASDRIREDADAQHTWHRILASGGTVRIGDLATESGYSHRQLRDKFLREYGLSPKQAARIVRFERSAELVKTLGRTKHHPMAPTPSLSEIAAWCGYYDQAHMTRDWNDLAGCPPSEWLRSENLPFVQDSDGGSGPS